MNINSLLTIAENDEEDEIPPPPPPSKGALDSDDTPLPPPPLALKRGSVPPLPSYPPPIPDFTAVNNSVKKRPPPIPQPKNANSSVSNNSNNNSIHSGRRSTSPKVPGSKIRRATQSFIDDPKMLQFVRKNSFASRDKEETDMQMLRGIFAAFDENKNGKLNRRELSDALIALGFKPSEDLLQKYYTENLNLTGKKKWNISLTAFVNTSLKHLDAADDCTNDVMYLFKAFDKKLSGDVTAKMVRHFLHETVVPTRLSSQETDEFLLECMEDPKDLSEIIKYEDLVDKLLFGNR